MATRIYNTDTKEIAELSVISDGQDFLMEVIGGCNQGGMYYSDDMPDYADFAMDCENLEWWTRWAEREQRINDMAQERGEEAINAIAKIAADNSDMEYAQDLEEEYLGIR